MLDWLVINKQSIRNFLPRKVQLPAPAILLAALTLPDIPNLPIGCVVHPESRTEAIIVKLPLVSKLSIRVQPNAHFQAVSIYIIVR